MEMKKFFFTFGEIEVLDNTPDFDLLMADIEAEW